MKKSLSLQISALTAALIFGGTVAAQPRPDRGGPGGQGGFERAINDLKLSVDKRDTVLAAVRGNQDSINRMTEVVSAGLMLKIKGIVDSGEYASLKTATDKVRVAAGGRARVSEDDVIERIMAFDKNKTGKVTKEDLPERMQYLIEKGDLNKDGALDRDEVKKLAAELARDGTGLPGGRGGNGGNAGNGGGRGGNGAQVSLGSGLSLSAIEKAVGDLKLSDSKKEAVAAAIKAQKEEASKLTVMVRGELQLEVGEILTSEEYSKVKTIVERGPGVGERTGRNGPQGGRGNPRGQ